MKTRIATLIFLCLGAAFLVAGCVRLPLGADPIDSQLVDEGTGAPIEGAVVVAYWEIHQGSLGGDALPCGAANVQEAVTDKDGKFHIPGWGPTWPGCSGEMRKGNPWLYVFKPGYAYGEFANGPGGVETVTVTHSRLNDRKLRLKKMQDMDLTKRGVGSLHFDFGTLNTRLSDFTSNMVGQCNWKKIPKMIIAVDLQARQFAYPIDTFISQLINNDQWIQKVAPQCGSPKIFIEGLLKANRLIPQT